MLVSTPIIVLHRYSYSDTSWIVKALSPEFGVLSLLVKGGKSKASPFKAALDPLAYSEVILNHHLRKDLHIPREASLRQWFPTLRVHLDHLATAHVMAEILLKLAQLGGHFNEEFSLLHHALEQLEEGHPTPEFLARWLYQLSGLLGYSFSLDQCVHCHTPMQEPADLWPAQGGGICTTCQNNRHPAFSSSFIHEMVQFLTLESMRMDKLQAQRLEHFFLNYLKVHTGVLDHLRSWDWLLEVRKTLW